MILDLLLRVALGTLPAPAPGPAQPPAQARIVTTIPLLAAPGLTAQTANEVLDQVQKFYATIHQVTAQFRQAVTNETFGSTKSSDGKLYLMKPGKMRWDYYEEKKPKQVVVKKNFISNGTNLYVVEHDNMQVVKKNLQRDLMPVAVSFLYGKGDLKAEFNAELDTTNKYGAKGELVLRLTPKRPSAQYKNLILVVSPTDYHVTQSVIVDSSNNVNHFQFFTPDFQKPIKESWFEFDERSVKNYRIVDADQQQQQQSAPPPPPPPVAPKLAPKPSK